MQLDPNQRRSTNIDNAEDLLPWLLHLMTGKMGGTLTGMRNTPFPQDQIPLDKQYDYFSKNQLAQDAGWTDLLRYPLTGGK